MLIALLALVPAFLFIVLVWSKNPAGKRPLSSLGLPVALGVLATFIALIVGFVLLPLFETFTYGIIGEILMYFGLVAISEEGSKIFGLFMLERNKKIVLPYDALIFASLIGFGFGAFENCMYLLTIDPLSALFRALFAVPGHVTYGILMGAFFAKAVACRWLGDDRKRKKYLVLAFILPWFFHGAYDFMLACDMWWQPFLMDIAIMIWSVVLVFQRSNDPQMLLRDPDSIPVRSNSGYQSPAPGMYQPRPQAPFPSPAPYAYQSAWSQPGYGQAPNEPSPFSGGSPQMQPYQAADPWIHQRQPSYPYPQQQPFQPGYGGTPQYQGLPVPNRQPQGSYPRPYPANMGFEGQRPQPGYSQALPLEYSMQGQFSRPSQQDHGYPQNGQGCLPSEYLQAPRQFTQNAIPNNQNVYNGYANNSPAPSWQQQPYPPNYPQNESSGSPYLRY